MCCRIWVCKKVKRADGTERFTRSYEQEARHEPSLGLGPNLSEATVSLELAVPVLSGTIIRIGMDSDESWRKCDGCKQDWSACHCSSICPICESLSRGPQRLFRCSILTSMPRSPSCVYYSPRIQGLYEGESTEFDTATEHWTEVETSHMEGVERIGEENKKYFNEVLMEHPEWGAFFRDFQDLKVGKKIGEGGQAEIFEATTERDTDLVAKVFKKEMSLEALEQHWPPQMMSTAVSKHCHQCFANVLGGVFIKDGEYKNRFAFVMWRRWGDLRNLLDQRMLKLLRNNKHGPPLKRYSRDVMIGVLGDLKDMHELGLVHRDIKASNVLIDGVEGSLMSYPSLMDFECSLGILGTGFWRAPEILEQVQRRVPSHEVVYTKEADIYSFGMLSYEILTGVIPFEGHSQDDYNIVLRGERPRLPTDLVTKLRKLVLSCWHHDPQKRPSAHTLYTKLHGIHF